jgi:hypothetical protein
VGANMNKRRAVFIIYALIATVLGILSRIIHTGNHIFDKYLGDALYAVLIYLILGIVQPQITLSRKIAISTFLVLLIEMFQLTEIPLRLSYSSNILLRIISIALGTKFSLFDIVAYLTGLIVIYLLERFIITK